MGDNFFGSFWFDCFFYKYILRKGEDSKDILTDKGGFQQSYQIDFCLQKSLK